MKTMVCLKSKEEYFMKKLWFIIAAEDDGSFKAVKKRIKELGNRISDYQISKRFKVSGMKARTFTIICSEETYKEILNCGYETTDVVLKD